MTENNLATMFLDYRIDLITTSQKIISSKQELKKRRRKIDSRCFVGTIFSAAAIKKTCNPESGNTKYYWLDLVAAKKAV
ncbi:UNVERIFIED_CONTAM: hypothetical protein ACS92_07295 [Bacillus cereus]